MMHAFKITIPAVLLLALTALAVAPPSPTATPFANRAADQLDFLYTASDRPVLIRLHLRVGDKPYPALWEAYLDKLFAWFDKDSDGGLSSVEAARIVPAQLLSSLGQGAIGGPRGQTVPFVSLDTNKDGKVSKEEFRAYYRTNGQGPLRFATNNSQAQVAKQVNDSIYRRLGQSPKSKLSKDDVDRLAGMLVKLDANEDESLVASELNTEGEGESMYGGPYGGNMTATATREPSLVEIQPTHTAAGLAAQIFNHYDANRDRKLTPGERGLDKAFIEQFDADKDGKLTAKELEAFFRREPDVVLRAKVGAMGVVGMVASTGLFGKTGIAGRAEIVNHSKLSALLAKKVKKVDGDNVTMELGDARVNLQVTEGATYNPYQGSKSFYLMQFDMLDDQKKGFIERKDNPNDFYVMPMFTYADKNADGKLHKKEYSDWLDLAGESATTFVTLQANDNGRALFDVMDVNSDGKLSLRELRAAWLRVEPLCKDGKSLGQEDLPRTLQLMVGQGFVGVQRGFVVFAPSTRAQTPVRGKAPSWFTKMDINGDGDVSIKEWLGGEEKFNEIDADKDGLISSAEAMAFEAKKAKISPKK